VVLLAVVATGLLLEHVCLVRILLLLHRLHAGLVGDLPLQDVQLFLALGLDTSCLGGATDIMRKTKILRDVVQSGGGTSQNDLLNSRTLMPFVCRQP
jgi:hypothetical protein